jgi:hypothetical protein
MTTVFVGGALANRCSNGGGAWVRLNWILGLRRLGCKVVFVEEIRRENCVDENGMMAPFKQSVNRTFFQEIVRQFGLAESSALVYENGELTQGLSVDELMDLARGADLLVNLGGHLTMARLIERFRCKVYIDLDPGFTQIWHESGNAGARLSGHDLYFTVGTNIGAADCPIPTCGIHWHPILPPIVLAEWPVSSTVERGFTTVASWRGPFGPVQLNGKTLGLKLHEFRKFLELPEKTGMSLEMALNIHPTEKKDLQALGQHGWKLADPKVVAGNPACFRRYIQGSAAEFSAAQEIYVATASGWFSDRTAAYLASGKPALVQDTGLSRALPTGAGLVTFGSATEAAAAARRIMEDYPRHCRAARALGQEFLDSDQVLGRFLEQTGIGL